MRIQLSKVAILVMALSGSSATAQGSPPPHQGVEVELTKSFHTRSDRRLVVTEGPPTKDYGDNAAPGALTLCLRKGPAGPCVSDPVTPPPRGAISAVGNVWEPHYLFAATVVYPRGPKAAPFLMIVTGSLNSGDGDQIVATQLIAYDADKDAFRRVYGDSTGRNNNQEIRFVTNGPLRGSVISAKPQEHSPYGYWIVVNSLTPSGAYRQVLRYPSATRYNDGNPLPVIDSEMPNIERRLDLWKPGQLIPTPNLSGGKPCLKPALRHTELWCG